MKKLICLKLPCACTSTLHDENLDTVEKVTWEAENLDTVENVTWEADAIFVRGVISF